MSPTPDFPNPTPPPADFSLYGYLNDPLNAKPEAIVTCTRAELSALIQDLMKEALEQGALQGFERAAIGLKGELLGQAVIRHFSDEAEPPNSGVSRQLLSKTICTCRRNWGHPIDHPKMARAGHKPGWKSAKTEGQQSP